MSTANLYVPTECRLVDRNNRGVLPKNKAHAIYTQDILQYGPLPPEFKVELGRYKSVNAVLTLSTQFESTTTSRKSWEHPLSPNELRVRHEFKEEFQDVREDILTICHPPLPTYKAGKLVFHHHDNWMAALAASLTASGVCLTQPGIPTTEHDVSSLVTQLRDENDPENENWPLQQELYHPSDRGTAVFANEAECARVARYAGRSLVILAPQTPGDGTGWNRFWSQQNRPPIRYRWSTGDQADLPLAVVVCLPKFDAGSTKEAHWLTVTPTNRFKATWDSYFQRDRSFTSLKNSVGFPEDLGVETFLWTLVACHRTVLKGLVPRDTNLGRWVYQYGRYLKRDPSRTSAFRYDANSTYDGLSIDHKELGAWILHSKAALVYVQLWIKANTAHVKYLSDSTDDRWDEVSKCVADASKLPA